MRFKMCERERENAASPQTMATEHQNSRSADGGHRPPTDGLGTMKPTASLDGLERRVCPNCRLYFDVSEDADDVFCSASCRERHRDEVYMADGYGEPRREPPTAPLRNLATWGVDIVAFTITLYAFVLAIRMGSIFGSLLAGVVLAVNGAGALSRFTEGDGWW